MCAPGASPDTPCTSREEGPMLACAYACTNACLKIEHFGNLQFGHAVCSSVCGGVRYAGPRRPRVCARDCVPVRECTHACRPVPLQARPARAGKGVEEGAGARWLTPSASLQSSSILTPSPSAPPRPAMTTHAKPSSRPPGPPHARNPPHSHPARTRRETRAAPVLPPPVMPPHTSAPPQHTRVRRVISD